MSLRLNGSTSGYTELDAGAVAGNNTIKMPTANGSAYQVLRNGATAGTTEFGGAIVSGTAVASTSGTSIDFTGIPSWVKRVTVMFAGVSTNGTSNLLVQLGTSGGVEATNYLGCENTYTGATAVQFTTGFLIKSNVAAASVFHGVVLLQLLGTNIWTETGQIATSNTTQIGHSAGSKALAAVLDRVRITTVNGTDAFDAGTINLLWE